MERKMGARLTLAQQAGLDKTFTNRMTAMKKPGRPGATPALEVSTVKEHYDETINRQLSRLKDQISEMISLIEEGYPELVEDEILTEENIEKARQIIMTIEVSKIENFDAYYGLVMEISELIDQACRADLDEPSQDKLRSLQDLLMDTLE